MKSATTETFENEIEQSPRNFDLEEQELRLNKDLLQNGSRQRRYMTLHIRWKLQTTSNKRQNIQQQPLKKESFTD